MFGGNKMKEKISIEELKKLALALKFDMPDAEYEQLQKDFEILLQQVDFINQNIDTSQVKPMDFPFPVFSTYLRDDEEIEEFPREEILKNAQEIEDHQIKIMKVVE